MPIEHVDLVAAAEAAEREAELHSLPELFLENTRLHPHQAPALRRRARELAADPYRRRVLRQSCKTYASSPRLALPDPHAPRATPPFHAVLAAAAGGVGADRFSGAPLGVEDLSRLLFYGHGAGPDPGEDAPRPRTSPSAGELHPLELYAAAIHVEGVPSGVYHFNAWLHCLEALQATERAETAALVSSLLADGAGCRGAAAALFTTAIPLRTCAEHGDRGYRLLLLEAGQVAQCLSLGALALRLALRPVLHFYDGRADALLGVDGVDELTIGVHLVGHRAGEAP